jgi:EAL domain-containing protein (putative c-di-GMP-specific phosphodiesterase class I)
VDVRSGKIVSFEALARWVHPEQGPISPEVFIPLAEDLGLLNRLSGQLFHDACRQASSWPSDITLSFNFSPNQLRDARFGEAVLTALDETSLAPYRLEVEITEGALVNDFAVARQILRSLKSAGASIVMDDFGTGYSSLRHLRELQFDKIKIDRSFVKGLASNDDCAAIVSAVAGLCRCLDIDTVAEGIETEEQLQLVRAAGCTHAQGFLFARPRSAFDLEFTSFNSMAAQVGAALSSRKQNRAAY